MEWGGAGRGGGAGGGLMEPKNFFRGLPETGWAAVLKQSMKGRHFFCLDVGRRITNMHAGLYFKVDGGGDL